MSYRLWVWCPEHRIPRWMSTTEWSGRQTPGQRPCEIVGCTWDVELMPDEVQAAERLGGWEAAYPMVQEIAGMQLWPNQGTTWHTPEERAAEQKAREGWPLKRGVGEEWDV